MEKKINLSIVVPVYNTEEYLALCLDSILAAKGSEEIEFLLIDDGSTDSSGKICDSYSETHENIRVIHKKNEGISTTRNLGMKEARGKYVYFCDADDMVVPVLFEKVIKLSNESDEDMFLWDSELIYEMNGLLAKKDDEYFAHYGLEKTERTYTGKKIIVELILHGKGFIATVWLGAYRRDFLLENGIFFEDGLIYEDEMWVPKVLLASKTVHYIPEKIYQYRVRKGSVTNPDKKKMQRNIEALIYVYSSLYAYYDQVLPDDPLLPLIKGNLTKRYLHMIYKLRFWKYGYGKRIDKKLLWKTSRRLIDKMLIIGLYVIAH